MPMHYVLKNDKANSLGAAPLPYGKVRIFIEGGGEDDAATPRSSARTGASSRRVTTRCGCTSASRRTSSSSARSRRTSASRIAGNLFDHEVVVKYEIENFKDQPVTLDVVENLRHLRNEVRGDTGRDVDWELGHETTFGDGRDAEKSTFEKLLFHVDLPARDKDGKAEKITHKLHLILKNEW